MRRHLLVTNDYPPKVGGIQSYLWELWRRLPPDDVAVHTTPHRDAGRFDAEQDHAISRSSEPWLLPTRSVARRHDISNLERRGHTFLLARARGFS